MRSRREPLLDETPLRIGKQPKSASSSFSSTTAKASLTIGIIALLLGIGIAIGYGIWISRVSSESQQSDAEQLQQQQLFVSMIQAELAEVMQNGTSAEGVERMTIQNGTINWRMTTFNMANQIQAPFGPTNTYDTSEGVYEIEKVQLHGLVNLTYLILYPPARALSSEMADPMLAGSRDYVSILAVDFEPSPLPVRVLGDAIYMAPLTPSNYARLSITPDCTIPSVVPPYESVCYQISRPINLDLPERPMNQRAILFYFARYGMIREEYVGFEYRGPMDFISTTPGLGTSWTLTDPLRILIPSA